jgi:hypothetical protein
LKVRAARGITWIVQNAKNALAIVWCTEESEEEEESEVASEGENAPETSTSPRCTFAGPRGAGLFAAADRSCQQMRLLKAACRWTAYRGWRRTSYPLMSEKMCPRTYLVCTLSFNRFKQQTLALCYERSPANAHHHPHRSHSRCSVRNAILLKWQTNLTKFLPRAEACQGFKVRTQVGRSCVGSTISDPNPFPVR